MAEEKKIKRREFINNGVRIGIGLGLGTLGAVLTTRSIAAKSLWQIDPAKCIQCEKCATSCVLEQSAVKCVHVTDMCGYCDLCGGYSRPDAKELNTAAENRLCPTGAIRRKYVEEPFFEYTIVDELCIGCGKCVKGCGSFGNGSLQLQVNQDLCVSCNQCAIARVCPSQAFTHVDDKNSYLLKGFDNK